MNPTLEDLCMAFRFAYYVEGRPLITDAKYDVLEDLARKVLPPSSPMQSPGSDLRSSYTTRQQDLAWRMRSAL